MVKLLEPDIQKRIGKTLEETVLCKALQRLPDLHKNGPWICGGAVRKAVVNESLDSDFDFFFRSENNFKEWKTKLVRNGLSLLKENEKNEVWILPTSIDSENSVYLPEMKVQLIKFRWYDSIQDVLESFDFTISQFGFDGENIYCGDWSLFDLSRKKLVPLQLTYAMSSFRRLTKYAAQGFTFCSGGLADMLQQVSNDPSIIHSESMYID